MTNNDVYICPVCSKKLSNLGTGFCCENGHSFDKSKDGYVNLLLKNKDGSLIGDNKNMANCRKSFLNKGYYECLAGALVSTLNGLSNCKAVLDVCCGEGYYTEYISKKLNDISFYGFDISKEMIRLAAKRKSKASFFVANLTAIPLEQNSIDVAFELFAPLNFSELNRIIAPKGHFIYVTGGKNHLMGLKKAVYDTPYFNEEAIFCANGFVLENTLNVCKTITLNSSEDIINLFMMTPYCYHCPSDGLARLKNISVLTTELDFMIYIFRKDSENIEL